MILGSIDNEFTLRALAERVGMRGPSLYTHFESKNAIYDAMCTEGCISGGSLLSVSSRWVEARLVELGRRRAQGH
jgi:Bacterial regulatory proteins, tetR family